MDKSDSLFHFRETKVVDKGGNIGDIIWVNEVWYNGNTMLVRCDSGCLWPLIKALELEWIQMYFALVHFSNVEGPLVEGKDQVRQVGWIGHFGLSTLPLPK